MNYQSFVKKSDNIKRAFTINITILMLLITGVSFGADWSSKKESQLADQFLDKTNVQTYNRNDVNVLFQVNGKAIEKCNSKYLYANITLKPENVQTAKVAQYVT